MDKMRVVLLSLLVAVSTGAPSDPTSINPRENLSRSPRTFSLFSIVQFPNELCTVASSTGISGTCLTSMECTTKGGSADGACAAGFGVCCLIATSTCGAAIAHNTTYIRNPNYPTSYTPASTSETCSFTVNKATTNVCQLRLDFQLFTGMTVDATAHTCTDILQVTGNSGVNPPEICGINTGSHMYVDFGPDTADTATVKLTYGDIVAKKNWNILLTQIECDAPWRAPGDCLQWFTGTTGTITSFAFLTQLLLPSHTYNSCIRTEVGMCGIKYCQSALTGTLTSTFNMAGTTTSGAAKASSCKADAYGMVIIPNLTLDGVHKLQGNMADAAAATVAGAAASYDVQCGEVFGLDGLLSSSCLASRNMPFRVGVSTNGMSTVGTTTGFSLDYEQTPCI